MDDAAVASGYSPSQRKVIDQLLSAAGAFGASPREKKALLEAGSVESNFTPLVGGDRDSTGVLQQRPSQGWGPVGQSVQTDALQFLKAARAARGVEGSAGALAQAVQRSGFPGRYDQHSGEAAALLGGSAPSSAGGTGTTSAASGQPSSRSAAMTPASTAGVDALLTAVQQPPATRSVAGLQAPSFSAAPTLATGAQVPVSGGGAPRTSGVDALLSAASQAADTSAPQSQPTTGSATAGRSAGSDVAGVGSALVQEATQRANTINAKKLPYAWGGGHSSRVDPKTTGPLDCSGAVSAVLGINPRVSGQFERFGSPGAAPGGKGITIYANKTHVLMEINGHFFGTSHANPGGGAGWIPRSQLSSDYLSNFTARHLAASSR